MTLSQQIGQEAETLALEFLQQHGLKLVEKNFLCKVGEIDLIMKDNDNLVFVEVRKRKHQNFGSELESITSHKIRHIVQTALFYLQSTDQVDQVDCRFDVIGIDSHNRITWIKSAFEASV